MTVNSVIAQSLVLLGPLVPGSITTLARKDEAPLRIPVDQQPAVLVGLGGDESEDALSGERHGVNLARWTLLVQVWKTYNGVPSAISSGSDFLALLKAIEDVFRTNRTLAGGADIAGVTQVNLVQVNRKRHDRVNPYITAGAGQHTRYETIPVQVQEYVLT